MRCARIKIVKFARKRDCCDTICGSLVSSEKIKYKKRRKKEKDTMGITDILSLLGGLALFLYGMHMMSNGLEAAAGNRMKSILEKLTSNRIKGVLVGAVITAVIQSSSATTVMLVGFVNSGLMTLSQAVWVIMGANIGTTITGQLIALDISAIAPIFAIGGVAAMMFIKNEKVHHISGIFSGLGILFMGMAMMGDAMVPLQDSQTFINFMTTVENPLVGILIGAIFTAIIQSSSASVGILQALAATGMVPLSSAVYILFGQNIGTCATALLSCIGTTRTAKRAAVIHLLFNVTGAVVFGVALYIVFMMNPELAMTRADSVGISIFHTIFNVVNTCIMFPFAGFLVKASDVIVPKPKETEKEWSANSVETEMIRHLDDRILETPSFAIETACNEVVNMGKVAVANLKIATAALVNADDNFCEQVFENEETIDRMEKMLTEYLLKINNLSLNDEQHLLVKNMYYTIGDLERVGDHCENLAELAKKRIENVNIDFSDLALKELRTIADATLKSVEASVEARQAHDMQKVRQTARWEEEVDSMEEEMRENHMNRLSNGDCKIEGGVIFLDALANYERIADHAKNVAGYVKEEMQ